MIQRSQQKFWAILPSDPYPEIGFERTLGRRILEAILSSNPLIAVRHEVDEVLAAKLSKDHRSTSIYTASSKRMFISSFWSRGVLLANYGTSSLPQVVQAVKSWLVDDLTLLQMKEKTANLVVSDVALATEAGEGVAAR